MSDYTPTEQELIEGSTVSADERRRAIARIKAEAWDEGAAKGSDVGADAIILNPMHANPYREEEKHD